MYFIFFQQNLYEDKGMDANGTYLSICIYLSYM